MRTRNPGHVWNSSISDITSISVIFHTYNMKFNIRYETQMNISAIQLAADISSLVTAHPLAKSNKINMKDVRLRISKISPAIFNPSSPRPSDANEIRCISIKHILINSITRLIVNNLVTG
jgi:hypothetical protein